MSAEPCLHSGAAGSRANFAAQPTSRFGSCVSSSLANRGNVSFDTQERGCFVLEVVHILRSLVLIKG